LSNDEPRNDASVETTLRSNLLHILRFANDVSHIPVLHTENSSSTVYNFDLTVVKHGKGSGESSSTHHFLANVLPKNTPSSARFSL
jgi:hypothetical protein